ncbi:hypothetical protein DN069_02765 [Streptacidiphilus pinicola]|uniref:Proteinase inhibitor I42 chagasin domain-containing protein n=1 Tax=Streptacidiphilus pinicola TaxID=2219663 RepID=A0A2X0IU75_9ACTN|nr:hypothetical protein [Streptacidiphilus pinicola]RAG87183.1 hypothetical protein DN069_02765 [Streptacidiphilus pinicola]
MLKKAAAVAVIATAAIVGTTGAANAAPAHGWAMLSSPSVVKAHHAFTVSGHGEDRRGNLLCLQQRWYDTQKHGWGPWVTQICEGAKAGHVSAFRATAEKGFGKGTYQLRLFVGQRQAQQVKPLDYSKTHTLVVR